MTQHFAPLFTVAVNHSYYSGHCEDLEFFVPPETSGVMRGGKVLTRVLGGRLHALYGTDSPGLPINNLAGRTLLFGLRLRNSTFSNFTDPVVNDTRQTPFYFNGNNPAVLEPPQGIILASGMHAHVPQTATRPLTLRLSDHNGTLLVSQTLPTGAVEGSFDLRALPEGRYQIGEDPGGGSVALSRLYVSAKLRSAGLWGLIAITVDAGFYAAPPALTLDFTARQEQLKYFVVAKNFTQLEFDQLNVTDNGFNEEGRPQLNFDKVPPNLFSATDISPALLGDGDSRIVMFRSLAAVARNERGFRKIQLNRNGDVLVSHLPQPSADKPQAHFIIHLSKP